MKYPMFSNTDRPLFEYMVIQNGENDYYLYDKFDTALKKAVELSRNGEIGCMYELEFNAYTREYKGRNTFTVYEGETVYDRHKELGLHIHFYINAGDWLNPNGKWLDILKKDAGVKKYKEVMEYDCT